MNYISFLMIGCSIISMSTCSENNKRPKHKPKQNTQKVNPQEELGDNNDNTEAHEYNPNPVVLAGIGQMMNGALSIAQNPHSRPNLGHSIATILHGIMSIIIGKVARKNIDINDKNALEECLNEICSDMSEEITEIIIQRLKHLRNNKKI